MTRILLFLICFLNALQLEAAYIESIGTFLYGCEGHRFSIGPEVYHTHRKRAGGTFQDGWLYGGELRYEFIHPNKFYYCARGEIVEGRLSGMSGGGFDIESHVCEGEAEGRLGYTFGPCWDFQPLIIPFVGYGYFSEKSKYIDPTPLHIHFHNFTKYVSWGVMTEVSLCHSLTVGMNIIGKYFIDPKCHVSNDPFMSDTEMLIESEPQFELELPISYRTCFINDLYVRLVPFYKYRHFGGRENFPFDFYNTQFNIYGARLMFSYEL